jgi:hypothetical protein
VKINFRKKSLLASAISCFLAHAAISQTWQLTGLGTNDWLCIASSANGKTLIAGQWVGLLGVSTDGGVTWTTNVMTNGYWNSVASSADGTKLLAASANVDSTHVCGVFLSTNSGASWVSNDLPAYYWGCVAMSADGTTMAAIAPMISGSDLSSVCAVFCSTNSGLNWVSNDIDFVSAPYSPPSAFNLAMSADGRKIFVVTALDVCYSTNAGTSWMVMSNAPSMYGATYPNQVIASSADGNKLILCDATYPGNGVYISTNSGNTWNLTSVQTNLFFAASSADGKTLMASPVVLDAGLLPLYISTNSGASWTADTNENWTGAACSADGGTLFAIAESDANLRSGAIYKYKSMQSPLLSVAPSAGNLQLSWLVPSTDFVLELSADLENWSAMTNAPALDPANLEDQILISPTNGAGFYRLATVPAN